jgi:hypothetical protein
LNQKPSLIDRACSWYWDLVMGFVIALVLVACFPSHAATVTQSHFPPNPGLMPGGGWTWSSNTNWADPPPPRQWVNGTYGGVKGVTAIDTWTLSGRAGPLQVQRPIFSSLSAIGAALARCLGNFICATVGGVAVASIPAAMDRLRIHRDPVIGDVRYDEGVDPPAGGQVECWRDGNWGDQCLQHGAAIAACEAAFPVGDYCTRSGNTFIVWYTPNGDPLVYTNFSAQSGTTTAVGACPASIDPFDSQYNVPAGEPPGIDGKCRRARYYWQPVTPEAAGQRLDQYPPAPGAQEGALNDALQDALERGADIPGSESLPMSGPSSQTGTGSTTTTTLPGGGTRTETRTPTYTYTYGDTNITYNTSYTTIINNNGEVTTIEEDPPPAEEQSDFCVDNPNVLACLQLGDPPSAPQPPSEQVITYEVDALGLPAGCPAPMEATFPVVGLVSVAWTPICDLAPLVRAMLLAMSAFGAALVIVMNVRQAA